MADEPSKTPGIPAEHPSPQMIPLSKIHDLPGMFIQKQPDKNYGGLVSSIQASGVKEPVILRLREDGEYQLVQDFLNVDVLYPAVPYVCKNQNAWRKHLLEFLQHLCYNTNSIRKT